LVDLFEMTNHGLIPERGKMCFLLQSIQTCSGAHPASHQ